MVHVCGRPFPRTVKYLTALRHGNSIGEDNANMRVAKFIGKCSAVPCGNGWVLVHPGCDPDDVKVWMGRMLMAVLMAVGFLNSCDTLRLVAEARPFVSYC